MLVQADELIPPDDTDIPEGNCLKFGQGWRKPNKPYFLQRGPQKPISAVPSPLMVLNQLIASSID
jgi:hypothetical protein